MPDLTPSQTIGPFFHSGAGWLVHVQEPPAGWVRLSGRLWDLNAKPVSDALLEFSLPASANVPGGPALQRQFTDDAGEFHFVMPDARFVHVTIFARGLLRHLFTRVYLSEQAVPNSVPAARRSTLVAQANGACYRWDIRLRGEDETVFFDLR